MAGLYLLYPKRTPGWHDWPEQAIRVLRDLTFSPECSERDRRVSISLPYVSDRTKPPESMVQLPCCSRCGTTAGGRARGPGWLSSSPVVCPSSSTRRCARSVAGCPVGHSRSRPRTSSRGMRWTAGTSTTSCSISRAWRSDGDRAARRLFLRSLPSAISIARRFGYRWPVFFDQRTYDVVRAEASPGAGRGERRRRPLRERDAAGLPTDRGEGVPRGGRAGAASLEGRGFRLGYQMNTTMLGAQAMLRLWKITGDEAIWDLLDTCVANFVDNLGSLGVPIRHRPCPDDLLRFVSRCMTRPTWRPTKRRRSSPSSTSCSQRALTGCAPRRGSCSPSTSVTPRTALGSISPGISRRTPCRRRNGSGGWSPLLAFPVEDLTDGWQQSGQVGQEVYGSALAFVAATRHFRSLPGTHLRFHCDYPLSDFATAGRRAGTPDVSPDRRPARHGDHPPDPDRSEQADPGRHLFDPPAPPAR